MLWIGVNGGGIVWGVCGGDSLCGGVKRSDAWTCVFSRWEAPQGKRQAGPGVS